MALAYEQFAERGWPVDDGTTTHAWLKGYPSRRTPAGVLRLATEVGRMVTHATSTHGQLEAAGEAGPLRLRRRRPRQVTVWYRGIAHTLDLVLCRRALVNRQVEGRFDSMQSLADTVGISRSTASRFFSGRPTSLTVTLKILDVLGLAFEDVARSVVDDEDPEGAQSVAV